MRRGKSRSFGQWGVVFSERLTASEKPPDGLADIGGLVYRKKSKMGCTWIGTTQRKA
jgi:hypothetical protein